MFFVFCNRLVLFYYFNLELPRTNYLNLQFHYIGIVDRAKYNYQNQYN